MTTEKLISVGLFFFSLCGAGDLTSGLVNAKQGFIMEPHLQGISYVLGIVADT